MKRKTGDCASLLTKWTTVGCVSWQEAIRKEEEYKTNNNSLATCRIPEYLIYYIMKIQIKDVRLSNFFLHSHECLINWMVYLNICSMFTHLICLLQCTKTYKGAGGAWIEVKWIGTLPVQRFPPGQRYPPHCWHAFLWSRWYYGTGRWWKKAHRLWSAQPGMCLPLKEEIQSIIEHG